MWLKRMKEIKHNVDKGTIMTTQKEYSKLSDSEKKKEDWMNAKWRPMMGWIYMLTCVTDFIIFPILWSILQASLKQPVMQVENISSMISILLYTPIKFTVSPYRVFIKTLLTSTVFPIPGTTFEFCVICTSDFSPMSGEIIVKGEKLVAIIRQASW